jgi:ribosomal protein S18 acetylase RimI-like enzyme
VRSATVRDAEEIGAVHTLSWQAAYRGLIPQAYLDSLDPVARGDRWRTLLQEGLLDRQEVLVAETGGKVVGFANLGPSRDHDAGGNGEVRALYLLPEHWGCGFGRLLMEQGLDALAAMDFPAATLCVLEGNDRARRFYERGGWVADGQRRKDRRLGFTLHESRYHHSLGQQRAPGGTVQE